MTNYLQEVIGMAGRYLRVAGTAPTIDDLSGWLHQPLARLIEPVNFAPATASIAQARIAVEVLRAVLRPPAPRSLDRRYRAQAYEALLRELGTSSEELRLARIADEPTRQALADRLGIGLGGVRPDRLDTLTIPPDEITDRDLESLFGYRSTNPTDPLAVPEPAIVLLWRQDALRASWARADIAERDGADGPQPVIDPDLIVEAHLRSQDPADAARRLWTRRRSWIDRRVAEISAIVDGAAPTAAGFDAALHDAGLSIDLVALAARDAEGADITAELAALGLTLNAFRYLARIRALADTGTVTASERRDVASILVQVRKRRVFRAWRREERQSGVVLSPDTFVADVDDDQDGFTGVLRWRADGTVLIRWRRTLTARRGQAEASTAGHQTAIDAAERQVLAGLRDALIALIGRRDDPPRPPQQTADRLSRQLALDFRAAAGIRTTRVGQAVDSLQTLLVSLRSGLLTRLGGKPVTVDGEADFDLEWEWLQTYSRWRSAMEAFAYPENRLLPNLYLKEDIGTDRRLAPTNAFLTAAVRHGRQGRPARDVPRDTGPGPCAGRNISGPSEDRDRHHRCAQGCRTHRHPVQRPRSTSIAPRARSCCRTLRGTRSTPRNTRSPSTYGRSSGWCRSRWRASCTTVGTTRPRSTGTRPCSPTHCALRSASIYGGLALEKNTQSNYAPVRGWLNFVKELNPHFTARHRNRAYTRFTLLSIVECFLAFADSEFARNAPDSNARAFALYQAATDLLDLPEAIPETGPTVPFPVNPVWRSLTAHAATGLSKIHAGLNIAGQTELRPADSDNVLPSVYRYGVVIERAKALVAIAQQVESAYLSALERLDAANYDLLRAGHDLRTAKGTLGAQELRVDAAANGVEQAVLQRDRAQLQFDTFADRIDKGLNDWEQKALDEMENAAALHAVAAGFSVFGALSAIGAENPFGFFGSIASALSSEAASVAQNAQIAQTRGGFERQMEDWQLNRNLASKDVEIGNKQIVGAIIQHSIAEQERQIAADQLDHAAAVAEFLATKFTNAELYEWMSGVLARVYAFFLQQATAVARLAQAQLAFERQEPVDGYIAADYWAPAADYSAGAGTAVDRRGITGSARLLQDIFRLDQQAFDTDRRKLHIRQTIVVSQVAAYELQQFRDTGLLVFATPASLFDRDFPGHYLRLIKTVELSLIALVPPELGVRATLSASGVSRTVVSRGSFDTVTLRREPETIAFTAPIGATGRFPLQSEGAMLFPFEGMGVDAVWQLSLPKAANPFDYQTIADVLLTIEYTALDSPDHRRSIIESLDRGFTGDRSFSLRNQFPDAWYDLNNPDTVDPADRMTAVLPLTADDFPPHIADLGIAHITLFVVHDRALDDELTITSLRHTVAEHVTTAGPVHTVGGIAGTRRPGAAPWEKFKDSAPVGDWELHLEDTPVVRKLFADGVIQDLVVVFTLSGTTPRRT